MFTTSGILILLLLCAGNASAAIVYQDGFENNAGALNGRLPDTGSSVWQNTDGSFQVTNGVLGTKTNGLTSAWLTMPSISTGDIIRVSAVIVGNGAVNTDYISFGLVNAKAATYSSGAPWLSLLRRVDNDRGYLRGHSGPGSSGTNLLNSANLTETQGFTTTLNARNAVTMQYDTASGKLSVWTASEGGTTVMQYDGPVYYGGAAEAIVPMDAIKYLAVSFNRVDPLGASNPAYLDDLTVEIIPDGGDSTQVENNEPDRWTFHDCVGVQSNTLLQTVTNGASAQTWFFGAGIEVYVKEDAFTGYAQIYVDDRYMGQINTYSATDQSSVQVFSISGLRRTDHRFKIVQQGASGVKLDFIKVYDDPTVELDAPDVQASPVTFDSPDVSTFSGLTVLQTNTAPHIFHFRRSEADALKLSPDFAQWENLYDRLMGIVGKMYNEDETHLSGANADFPQRAIFRTFKTNHPDQMALLHFDGQLRNIATERTTEYYAPQHFLYYVQQPGYSGLSSAETQSVIRTTSPVYLYFKRAIASYRNEDVVLVKKADDGGLDWTTYEYTTLISYENDNAGGDGILVERGRYGSSRKNWIADDYYLLVPVSKGPWDSEPNNHWVYNFSTWCPVNNSGQTCVDVFSDEIAGMLMQTNAWSIPEFDGVEFDIMLTDITNIGLNNRGIDSNCDGIPDFGYDGEINRYGEGIYHLGQLLRQKLGNGKLILGDGADLRNQRCFGLFNGIEKESVIVGNDLESNDEWTTQVNRLRFWNAHAYAPALSYVNWKYVVEVDGVRTWLNLDQNLARLNLATLVAYDVGVAFYSYKALPVATNVHDEAVCGADQIIGWLGAPKGACQCLAADGTDLLGGSGFDVSGTFTNRIRSMGADIALSRIGSDPYSLKVSSISDGRITFRITDIDLSSVTNREITLLADMLSEKSGILPPAMQRQFEVRALDMEGNILEEHNMFAGNGSYMPNIIYFHSLGTGDTVQIEFDFEGCGYICLSNTGLYAAAPVLLREFDNGLVVANPSNYEVSLSLNAGYRHLTAQADAWKADYDQTVNDGALVTNPVVISARDGLFLLKTDPSIDIDRDQISDEWERGNFDGLSVATPVSDYDVDGSPDRSEFMAGTDPLDPLSLLRIAGLDVAQGGSGFVIRWPSAANRHYRVMTTPSLTVSPFAPEATGIPATPPENIYTNPAVLPGPVQFYRIDLE
jgi:hypothetical protein